MSTATLFYRACVTTALLLIVALPQFAAAQQPDKAIPVRIGIQAQTSWLMYTAKGMEFFKKAGLAPTFFKFTTGAQSIAAAKSKSIDFSTPGLTPFIVGVAQGVNWEAIGIDDGNDHAEGFLARADSDIKTLKDFKGKTIGVSRGSTSYYGLIAALEKYSIGKTDVKLLLLDPTAQIAALQKKEVDAVAVWQPWIGKMQQMVGARLIGMEADYGVHTAGAVDVVRREFAQQHPEAVKRFLRALVMAYDYIQKNGPGVAVKAVSGAMGVSESLAQEMYKQTGAPDPRGWIDPNRTFSVAPNGKMAKNMQEMANQMYKDRLITKKVDISRTLNPDYIHKVLQNTP